MSDDFDDLFDDDFGDFDSFDDGPAAGLEDEDDLFGGDDFTDFGDDDLDTFDDFDEDDFDSFDDLDENFLVEDETTGERSGPNRTFVLLAVMMVVLFLAGLLLIVFLALRDPGPDSVDLTTTAIVAINSTRMIQRDLTLTKSAEDADTIATQQSVDMEETTIAVENLTAEAALALTQVILDEQGTASAEANATEQAEANAEATLNAQTQAASPDESDEPPPTPETLEPVTQAPVGDIQATASAIAEALQNSPTPGENTGSGGGEINPTRPPSQLPDSGLFDDAIGSMSMGAIVLIAFGLIGIIFGARRLRVVNSRED